MDLSIASILTVDGVTNGAIYALLALATVLVFAITRVIFIGQGEFVAYGALTLAMLLQEAGWFDRLSIELLASDASPGAIARAREGSYGQRSFRNLPLAMQEKYFVAHDHRWTVHPDLHRRVSYDVVNLVEEQEVSRHATAPIIFCRNVFIYFSDESIRRALGVFERAMPVPGYLCVGAAESLLRRTVAFELKDIGGAFMYVKDTAGRTLPPRSQF